MLIFQKIYYVKFSEQSFLLTLALCTVSGSAPEAWNTKDSGLKPLALYRERYVESDGWFPLHPIHLPPPPPIVIPDPIPHFPQIDEYIGPNIPQFYGPPIEEEPIYSVLETEIRSLQEPVDYNIPTFLPFDTLSPVSPPSSLNHYVPPLPPLPGLPPSTTQYRKQASGGFTSFDTYDSQPKSPTISIPSTNQYASALFPSSTKYLSQASPVSPPSDIYDSLPKSPADLENNEDQFFNVPQPPAPIAKHYKTYTVSKDKPKYLGYDGEKIGATDFVLDEKPRNGIQTSIRLLNSSELSENTYGIFANKIVEDPEEELVEEFYEDPIIRQFPEQAYVIKPDIQQQPLSSYPVQPDNQQQPLYSYPVVETILREPNIELEFQAHPGANHQRLSPLPLPPRPLIPHPPRHKSSIVVSICNSCRHNLRGCPRKVRNPCRKIAREWIKLKEQANGFNRKT